MRLVVSLVAEAFGAAPLPPRALAASARRLATAAMPRRPLAAAGGRLLSTQADSDALSHGADKARTWLVPEYMPFVHREDAVVRALTDAIDNIVINVQGGRTLVTVLGQVRRMPRAAARRANAAAAGSASCFWGVHRRAAARGNAGPLADADLRWPDPRPSLPAAAASLPRSSSAPASRNFS